MRMNYLSQRPEEIEKLPPRKPDPELREPIFSHALAHLGSFLTLVVTIVAVGSVPYFLAKDFARVRRSTGTPMMTSSEMARSSASMVASGESLVKTAFQTAEYGTAWARLLWTSLNDFEDSMDLLKTPPDPNHGANVAQRRRQGAEQLVILLDRHGLLPLLNFGSTHEQTAQKIGNMLNIDPQHVAQSFRDAQRDQVQALKEALDRHLSDAPGPSDLSDFGAPTAQVGKSPKGPY